MKAVNDTKILIVEDDPDAAETLKIVLEDEGYQTLVAVSPEEALKEVHQNKPDLVLLDVMMPTGTEGFHFVWDLRREEHPDYRDIPIIVLSAIHRTTRIKLYPDQEDKTYGPYEYLPVQGFLDKPAASDKLLAEVKRVLSGESAT